MPIAAFFSVISCLLLACCLGAQQPPKPPEGYDADLWKKAWELHHNSMVIDSHSDTTSRILDEGFDIGQLSDTGHMDLPRIRQGGLDCQIYSIYVAASYFGNENLSSKEALRESQPNASARRAMDMMDGFYRSINKYPEQMRACFSVADIEKASAEQKHAALMGIEGGHAIEGDLGLLRMFYRLGIRYMTLTHTNHNHFADSSAPIEARWNGLNQLGVKVVKEMNRLGMLVDVSHVSDACFYQSLKVSKAPVILSHSSVRSICAHPRNVTDDMLKALAKNDGVIMINYNCGFIDGDYGSRSIGHQYKLSSRERRLAKMFPEKGPRYETGLAAFLELNPAPKPPGIEVLIDHIVHALQVAGADHVGLGSDFDGVDCVPKGLEDVSHLPKITYHLLQRGIAEETVRKVLGENFLRVFRKTEEVARQLAQQLPLMNDPESDQLPVKR